jgi:hypothetical protein
VADVVDEARREQEPRPGENAEQLRGRLDSACGDGSGNAHEQADEDADTAECRRRAVVPARVGRVGDQMVGE